MIETLKDYAVKALVNTVDHLGSVTFKVNDLLDNKIDEVSASEFRISSIEQVINRSFLLDFCFRYMAYSIEWWSDMQYFSSKCCCFSLETPNMPEVYRSRGLFPTISHHKHAKIPQTLHFTRQNSSLHISAFFLDHFSSSPNSEVFGLCSVGETMRGSDGTKVKYRGCSLDDEDEWHHFRNAVRATITETPSPSIRWIHNSTFILLYNKLLGTQVTVLLV